MHCVVHCCCDGCDLGIGMLEGFAEQNAHRNGSCDEEHEENDADGYPMVERLAGWSVREIFREGRRCHGTLEKLIHPFLMPCRTGRWIDIVRGACLLHWDGCEWDADCIGSHGRKTSNTTFRVCAGYGILTAKPLRRCIGRGRKIERLPKSERHEFI